MTDFAQSGLLKWAGSARLPVAVVFTDLLESARLADELGDETMASILDLHFSRSAALILQYQGRLLKGLGDGVLAVFRAVEHALDYAIALHADPGHERLSIRAGIHIGPVDIHRGDIRGAAVNFAARVSAITKASQISLSKEAHAHVHALRANRHSHLVWDEQSVELPGLGTHTVYAIG